MPGFLELTEFLTYFDMVFRVSTIRRLGEVACLASSRTVGKRRAKGNTRMNATTRHTFVDFIVALLVMLLTALPICAEQTVKPEATQIYKRPGDRDLRITLTFPTDWKAGDRRAAIVFFYNGGWKEAGDTRLQFEEQARYFAARGMVCVRADYRAKARGGVTSTNCIEDVCSAIRWVRQHAGELGIAQQRIAAGGGSGSIHIAASILYADEIHARDDDLSISPRPNALFLFDSDLDVLKPAMMRWLLTRDDSSASRNQFPPTIFFYGARDAMNPYAEAFVARARQAGLPIEAFVEDDGLHGAFKFSPWLEKTTARMDERLRELGFLQDMPRVELPAKPKPAGVDERTLANQARWLERHNQLEKEQHAASEKKLTESPSPEEPQTIASPPASHVYKTSGERKLQLAVHYPTGWKKEDRRPALLCFAGGGENPKDKEGNPYPLAAERAKLGLPVVNAGPGGGFSPVAEHFAKLGLVSIRIEYRKRKTDGVLPDKAVEDAKSAIRWVRVHATDLGVDPTHVVLTGASSGGHLAASLAALDDFDAATDDLSISCRPDALILHSPLLDFLEGGTRNTAFLSAVDNDRVLGERISPARHWSQDMPPTLLFTGEKEPVHEMLCGFAEKWKGAGQHIELVTGMGGHVFSLNEKWIAETLPRMEAFLKSIGYLDVAALPVAPLQSGDLFARTQAVLHLLELGQAARDTFPSLVRTLADDEPLDLAVAARAIYARPRSTADVPTLIKGLTHGTKARVSAAWELSRIGLPAGSRATPALIAALRHPDKHERNFIVVSLAMTGPQTRDVVSALLAVLQDAGSGDSQQTNYKYPRASAAVALGMMGAEAGVAVPTLVENLAEKGGWEYQRAANCFALGRIGPDASCAVAALRQALRDTSPIVHAHAAKAIHAIDPTEDRVAETVGATNSDDVLTLVRTLTRSPSRINPKVIDGLRALGEFAGASGSAAKKGPRGMAPPVHESISLAIGYLDSLAQPPDPEEIGRQEKAGNIDADVRQYLMALGGIQQSIAPVLLEVLAQGEQDMRVLAIRRLAALGPAAEEAIPALTEMLRDEDWLVRREAFLALDQIKPN